MTKYTKNIILSFLILLILGFIIYSKNDIPQKQHTTLETTQEIHIQENNRHLSWDDFRKKAQEKNTVVIDIRTPEEIAQGTLFDGVEKIDYYGSTFEQKVSQLDPTKTYLIYCRSGHRSGNAIPVFKKYGLKVYDLQGGYIATRHI